MFGFILLAKSICFSKKLIVFLLILQKISRWVHIVVIFIDSKPEYKLFLLFLPLWEIKGFHIDVMYCSHCCCHYLFISLFGWDIKLWEGLKRQLEETNNRASWQIEGYWLLEIDQAGPTLHKIQITFSGLGSWPYLKVMSSNKSGRLEAHSCL